MAIMKLSRHQAQMIADCLEIGLEGAAQNHEDLGGDNSQEDLEAIQSLVHTLYAFNEAEGVAGIELGIQMIDENGVYVQRHAHEGIVDAWFAREYGTIDSVIVE